MAIAYTAIARNASCSKNWPKFSDFSTTFDDKRTDCMQVNLDQSVELQPSVPLLDDDAADTSRHIIITIIITTTTTIINSK